MSGSSSSTLSGSDATGTQGIPPGNAVGASGSGDAGGGTSGGTTNTTTTTASGAAQVGATDYTFIGSLAMGVIVVAFTAAL
ncbi:hypothetical protein LTR10_005387 [Elasticomyces elasticus]|uniref:Uncharacterized protein n=1 Tax=Elasticomyces elasticus TaxID=574655 RepID=A0AAN7VRI3_9PEZI|nr:hypothetical protein LTR10_005387 [Elasticomyces elasticus]KAK4976126.1 hypothetical protein LTR42_003751 [Elasticomyces elasticus]KAK5690815.1 hypothetical protein LTR97_011976 [Elasticomyces elasticus]